MDFQKDIRPFLAVSDTLVFPSYREGFPNVVLQAGVMGLPAIVTNINGSNEIIEPGKNGVIIESRNEEQLYQAMESFVLEPDKVRMMAQNCRTIIAEKYDQRIVWAALLEEYKTLLKE